MSWRTLRSWNNVKELIDKHPLMILLTILFAAVALGAYQYYPVHLQRQALRQILQKQEVKLGEIQGYSEKLPILHRQVKELEPQAGQFDRLFPGRQGFSRLWQQIAEIMNSNHLSDQLVRPGEVTCSDNFCSIPLEIQCSGTIEDFFQFFRALEHFDRLIRMDEIHIRNDADLSGRLTLHAKARVFYQSEESQE